MVFFSVELSQGRPEVHADLRHDLFAQVEHLRVEHATPLSGDEHQVDVQVVDGAASAPSIGLWFASGCRRPTLRCVS
jgi:hypothetical protein